MKGDLFANKIYLDFAEARNSFNNDRPDFATYLKMYNHKYTIKELEEFPVDGHILKPVIAQRKQELIKIWTED